MDNHEGLQEGNGHCDGRGHPHEHRHSHDHQHHDRGPSHAHDTHRSFGSSFSGTCGESSRTRESVSSDGTDSIFEYYFGKGDDQSFRPATDALNDIPERQHLIDVCYSFLEYEADCRDEIEKIASDIKRTVRPEDLALLPEGNSVFPVKKMKTLIDGNQDFFDNVVFLKECQGDLPPNFTKRGVPDWHDVEERNLLKVRCTLRQLVRDWADEGARERETNYDPLLDALERYVPITPAMREGTEAPPRVVCPGSGLGRLPYDAVCRGYSAFGNEFSYHMLFVSDYLLNNTLREKQYEVYPYVMSLKNRKKATDNLRSFRIPNVNPGEYMMKRRCPLSEFSVVTGEFVEVFKDMNYFNAILTCFFIDTAKNFFMYVRSFASLVPEGGVWINIGPLLWHFAEQASEVSIELTWTQCKKVISEYFSIVEQEFRTVHYTVDADSIQSTLYNCIFYVARRNSTPVTGESNPVYGV
eukprot:GEMP01037087.1.p1 GENE.GEMP01037087.1~~GEMP01037087.1.p1  ORF type:complete len:469 (+),score=66.31 GEMP01037087.1:111-1517(+)